MIKKIMAFICIVGHLSLWAKGGKIRFHQTCTHASDQAVHFVGENEHAQYYEKLRKQFGLDDLVAGCTTQLDIILVVTNWVHNLWEHDSWNTPCQGDPASILHEVIHEHKRFRCVEYAKVIAGCLRALNIPCRTVGLKTADVQTREFGAGHLVCEAYLSELGKWVMIDGQANVVVMLGNKPLHAIELQRAIHSSKKRKLKIQSLNTDVTIAQYLKFIEQYLHYFDTPLNLYDPYFEGSKIMLVPLGSQNPTVFQRIIPLSDYQYTHCQRCFYPAM